MAGIPGFIGMPAHGSPYTMKGPPRSSPVSPIDQVQPVPIAGNFFSGVIHFYRAFISPIQGGRCGFYPSCSTFGLHSVEQHGPLLGVLMTTDRLTRCNIFKRPGPDYYLRPDGRLYDPPEANLLFKK